MHVKCKKYMHVKESMVYMHLKYNYLKHYLKVNWFMASKSKIEYTFDIHVFRDRKC